MSQTLRLTATVVPDGDWFVARCVEVEVASQGRTIEEALANLREALELYFEDEPAPEARDESGRAESRAALPCPRAQRPDATDGAGEQRPDHHRNILDRQVCPGE